MIDLKHLPLSPVSRTRARWGEGNTNNFRITQKTVVASHTHSRPKLKRKRATSIYLKAGKRWRKRKVKMGAGRDSKHNHNDNLLVPRDLGQTSKRQKRVICVVAARPPTRPTFNATNSILIAALPRSQPAHATRSSYWCRGHILHRANTACYFRGYVYTVGKAIDRYVVS